jgi:hypothetical protein
MSLSNAERQARWRARHEAEIKALRKATSKASSHELAEAKAEIARLRKELAAAIKAKQPPRPMDDGKNRRGSEREPSNHLT